ncbi:MAG: hypothetical protein U0795_06510 [Pirellulales bacterium]
MNRRTRILLSLMLGVGLLMAGDYVYRHWFQEPAEQHERSMVALRKKIDDLKVQAAVARKEARQLPELEQRSLPYDVEMAQAGYQAWLLQLVKSAGLASSTVNAEAPVVVTGVAGNKKKSAELYKKYVYTVRGRGEPRQVCQLLFTFYQGGFLHKIPSVSLNPIDGGRQLDITLRIEALGLARSDRKSEMPQPGRPETQLPDLAAYDFISRRNIFSHEGDSILDRIVFTGASYDRNGVAETWITLGGPNSTRVLKLGDSIAIGPHQLELIDLQGDRVLIVFDGELRLVGLGKSLRSGRIIPRSAEIGSEKELGQETLKGSGTGAGREPSRRVGAEFLSQRLQR